MFFHLHATSTSQDGDNLFYNWSLSLFLKIRTIVQIAMLYIICTILGDYDLERLALTKCDRSRTRQKLARARTLELATSQDQTIVL